MVMLEMNLLYMYYDYIYSRYFCFIDTQPGEDIQQDWDCRQSWMSVDRWVEGFLF